MMKPPLILQVLFWITLQPIISRTQSRVQAVDGNEITVLRRDVVQ